jgi:hypothetical protein
MPRYLISFDAHAMDHIPDEGMPAVTNASLAVSRRPSTLAYRSSAELKTEHDREEQHPVSTRLPAAVQLTRHRVASLHGRPTEAW